MTTATIMNELTMRNSILVYARIAIAYVQHLASQA